MYSDDLGLLWNTLSVSLNTIHTLSLLFDTRRCFHLYTLHFPHLCCLSLGWGYVPPPPEEKNLLDFIIAHSDTIEKLELSHSLDINVGFPLDSSLSFRRADMLPRLHTFCGSMMTFEAMAQARLESLKMTLRRLQVRTAPVRPASLKRTFEAILSPQIGSGSPLGRLSVLTEISLCIPCWSEGEWSEFKHVTELFARCCGSSLEVWKDALPPREKVDCKLLAEVAGMFEKLRVFHIHEENILGRTQDDAPRRNKDKEIEQYLTELALNCSTLENFVVRRSRLEDWTILRDPRGTSGLRLLRQAVFYRSTVG
jgi:hypothetical protein